jgi:heterogeneous nuclear ribonucleoprotein F/H/epithelial splicing regulatory protein 1/2
MPWVKREGEFLLQMADANVVVGCLCFQIPGMMGAFGVQGLTGMNLAAMQAAGLGGITGLPGLTDTSEHVCIKMRGLPYNATQREIMDFFDGLNIMPNGIHIVMGATDRPTGEAFVEFTSSDEAQRGMERHRQNIGSRYIELFRATKRYTFM